MKVKKGFYQHHEGRVYEVLYVGTHTESYKRYVVYKHVHEDRIWIRPEKMFRQRVKVGRKLVPRFQRLTKREERELQDGLQKCD